MDNQVLFVMSWAWNLGGRAVGQLGQTELLGRPGGRAAGKTTRTAAQVAQSYSHLLRGTMKAIQTATPWDHESEPVPLSL